MSNLFTQGKAIGLAAKDMLSLKEQSGDQRSKAIHDRIELLQTILYEQINTLQTSMPTVLPARFTVNGFLIDLTDVQQRTIGICRAPERTVNSGTGQGTGD